MSDNSTEPIRQRGEEDVTEIEKIELEKRALNERLDEAKMRAISTSLRASFVAMQDESVPVAKIISETISRRKPLGMDALSEFSERLSTIIKIHTSR